MEKQVMLLGMCGHLSHMQEKSTSNSNAGGVQLQAAAHFWGPWEEPAYGAEPRCAKQGRGHAVWGGCFVSVFCFRHDTHSLSLCSSHLSKG